MKRILIIFSILIITDLKPAELRVRRKINFENITLKPDPTKKSLFTPIDFDGVIAGITNHSEDKLGLFFIDMFLLTSNGDFNFQNENGLTMLICAAGLGHLDLVKHLIELGKGKIDINLTDKYGFTALDHALYEATSERAGKHPKSYQGYNDIIQFLREFKRAQNGGF